MHYGLFLTQNYGKWQVIQLYIILTTRIHAKAFQFKIDFLFD